MPRTGDVALATSPERHAIALVWEAAYPTMNDEQHSLLPAMVEARDRFMELVEELRPQLHRYCARMTGSVFDGEDVVQDTLAKAYYALGQMIEPPNLRPWLFRIAHNTAMDFLKRYEHKNVELMQDVLERAEADEAGIDPELVEAALGVFAGTAARSAQRRHPQRRARALTGRNRRDNGRDPRRCEGCPFTGAEQHCSRPSCWSLSAWPPCDFGGAVDARALRRTLQRS